MQLRAAVRRASTVKLVKMFNATLALAFFAFCGPSSPEESVRRRLDAADLVSGDFCQSQIKKKTDANMNFMTRIYPF